MAQKVLFVITKSVWGGAQKYVFDLATKLNDSSLRGGAHADAAILPKSNYDVSVALGGNGPLSEKLARSGIRVINIPSLDRDISLGKDWATFRSLLNIFREERPDIVHLNSSKIGLFGALAARFAGVKKIIFTAHGWIFNEDKPLPVKFFYALLSWLTGLFATDVIVLSEYEYEQTKKLPFVIKKTRLIRNGINEFETLPRAESRKFLSQKIGRPENFLNDKLIIGTISELHPNKGLEYAIKAFLPPLEGEDKGGGSSLKLITYNLKPVFIIIGSGESENKLRSLIKELRLENTVFLTGFINDAQRFLPAFDIFTLTSLKEGLPYVILEAGLLGLPIVATSVGAMPEISSSFLPLLEGEDRGGGSCLMLVKPKDVEGISAALRELINNPARRAELGARLKQKIAADFTYAAMLDATKRLYE